ncbi:uncharacterized protein LOC114354535 [Ostrinia furnacalis]|uniref:uncharacterized protein LOC114354535 n=1 Tax=Ostrinia furnacalis TaxID=93504 RepID=UPI00103D4351|nr:uncharacterized protein LOC114354535 [Ostrinia furnacalis]
MVSSLILLSCMFMLGILLLQFDYSIILSWIDDQLFGQAATGILYDVDANVVRIDRTTASWSMMWLVLMFFGAVLVFQFGMMVFYQIRGLQMLLHTVGRDENDHLTREAIKSVKALRTSNDGPCRKTLRNLTRTRNPRKRLQQNK